MKNTFFYLLCACLFSSCTQYFVCSDSMPVQAYADEDLSDATFTVPQQKQFLITAKKRRNKTLKWDQWNGFVSRYKTFANQQKVSKKKLQSLVYHDGRYVAESYVASRSYQSSGSSTYRPKTVQVRGYYRKNGTYVRPHTRSAPRRK